MNGVSVGVGTPARRCGMGASGSAIRRGTVLYLDSIALLTMADMVAQALTERGQK